jgi:glutaredoxin 3
MFCNQTKEFLSRNGIQFENRDITADPAAMEELEKRKLLTTPVTFVDGEMVVGFDRERLSVLLGLIPK